MWENYESIVIVLRAASAFQTVCAVAALAVAFVAVGASVSERDCDLEIRWFYDAAPLWLCAPMLASQALYMYAVRQGKLFARRANFLFWCLALMVSGYVHVAFLVALTMSERPFNCKALTQGVAQALPIAALGAVIYDVACAFLGVLFRELVAWEIFTSYVYVGKGPAFPTLD